MGKVLKILKINLLSIVALPILLLATASKLIAKALEKLAVIAGMGFLTLAVYFFFEILKKPDSILLIIAFMFLFILSVALVILIVYFGFAVITAAWKFLILVFNTIYGYTYLGYLKLYEICTNDYRSLPGQPEAKGYSFACLFYSVLNICSRLVVILVSVSLYLSIAASIIIVIASLISMNLNVKAVLGINLMDFISKFDTFSIVYSVAMYLTIIGSLIVFLVSLGIEWYEWAQELKMTGAEYSAYIHEMRENELQVEQSAVDADNKYLEKLGQHLGQIDTLEAAVNQALSTEDNPMLRSSWSDYLRSLTELTRICNSYNGKIPLADFKKLIPEIKRLDMQCESIKKMCARQKKAAASPLKNATFFSGCDTLEKVEKRYKSLCKAYHPDAEGGDENTFKTLQAEYEQIKEYLK
ncbi:MAG: hypothetical protein E7291_05905 [Lachnospiraceae bacterium]|nr:hypothetical protein [Lachnospiraceae bacterium]